MADVLTLLRNALSAKQTVEVDGAKTTLVFPDGSKHPIGAPSAYRQNRGQGDPYTIGAVWFYCTNPKLGFGQYRTQARPYGLINRIDQKDLLDYVTGETDSSVAVKEAETIFDAVDTRDAKRARLDDDADAAAAGGMDADAAAAAAAIEVEEEDFLPKCSTVEDILGREKSLSTRNSILLAPDPKHFSSVEGLYAATMKRKKEASKRRGPSPKSKSNREVERDLDRLRLGAKDGYYANRTEQNADAAMRSRVGGDVDINFGGTAASWTSSGSKSTKKDGGAKPAGASNPSESAVDSGPAPIIIVPTEARGVLTIFNVKDFLERGRYKTVAEAKAAGARRERRITLDRPMRGGSVKRYEVVDSARNLSKSDWSRVVAVFVSNGKLYQFSGWPKDVAAPVQIFTKFAGFNLRFSDEIPDPVIKTWKVQIFEISKNADKRYLDHKVVTEVWDEIDTVAARRKTK